MVTKLKAFFLLVRWPNLLMIALAPLMVRYGIIKSSLVYLMENHSLVLVMSSFHFLMLLFGIVCMAAAGYVINDYLDVKVDQINKPNRVVIGRYFTENQSITMYWILNTIALGLIFFVCYSYALTDLFFIFLLVSGLLWFYSTTYQHIWLVGNVLVALVVGVLLFLSCMIDVILLNRIYMNVLLENGKNINYLAYWILSFSGFAFLYTLIRELIKDMEDVEGDISAGSRTFPIVFGVQKTKVFVSLLYGVALVLLYVLHTIYLGDRITFWYLSLTVVLCSLFSLYFMWKGSKQFRLASAFNKLASVFGILFAALFYVILEFLLR